jgi:parallel beta-helix repeat protein
MYLYDAHSNDILGNVISGFGKNGICISADAADYNYIRGNKIYDNDKLGIDLGNDGVTPNDTGDTDTGANEGLNFPVITSTVETAPNMFDIIGTAMPRSTVDVFWVGPDPDSSGHGEGHTLLGWSVTDSTGYFNVPGITISSGTIITATATDTNYNTSEFAMNFAVIQQAPDIELSDSMHDFGEVPLGISLDWDSLWIYNVGSLGLIVDSLVLSPGKDPCFVVIASTFPDTISSLDSVRVTVKFIPQDTGFVFDTLFVHSNDPNEPVVWAALSGFGQGHAVEERDITSIPSVFFLKQSFPNPMRNQTFVSYGLPNEADVTLTICNLAGQEIRALVRKNQKAGYHSVRWNGRNDRGNRVASGVYFCKFDASEFRGIKKITIMQ